MHIAPSLYSVMTRGYGVLGALAHSDYFGATDCAYPLDCGSAVLKSDFFWVLDVLHLLALETVRLHFRASLPTASKKLANQVVLDIL